MTIRRSISSSLKIILGALGVLGGQFLVSDPTHAAATRSAPELSRLWRQMDLARAWYRDIRASNAISSCNDARRGDGGLMTFETMKAKFASTITTIDPSDPNAPAESPATRFRRLALGASGFPEGAYPGVPGDSFADWVDEYPDEANAGIQEALNELMSGQSLLGNGDLVRGLRTRFPGIVSAQEDPDQFTLLSQASTKYQSGINAAAKQLRRAPTSLRAAGGPEVNPTFPIFVENAPTAGQSRGEIVENEYLRFTDLVKHNALACNEIGRRQFFYGTGSEAGEAKAMQAVKRAATTTYLNSIVLGALQTRDQFFDNGGNELKRHVEQSQQTFEDIRNGFNPLKLLGDFVPRQPAESYLRSFRDRVADAAQDEAEYDSASRTYDQDQTAHSAELRSQRETYLRELTSLTGITASQIKVDYGDLQTASDLQRFRAAAEASRFDELATGQLRQAQIGIDNAGLQAQTAAAEIRKIPERIRIEEERQGRVAYVVDRDGKRFAAMQAGIAAAQCCLFTQTTEGWEFSYNTQYLVIAGFQSEVARLQARQEIQVEGINSAATVKNLLLEQETSRIAFEQAVLAFESANAELAALQKQVDSLIFNYLAAREDLQCAYFTNPAYRVQRDIAKENADRSFEDAMIEGYYAAKALEYEWAEKFSNPVLRVGGGAEIIGNSTTYEPFTRAESVFRVFSADKNAPTLKQFRTALSEWDELLRQLRGNEQQPKFTEVISLRKQVFGYAGGDEDLNRLLFGNLIAKNRKKERNPAKEDVYLPFALGLADQLVFPAEPNLKMVSMSLNIKSRPGRFAAESAWSGQPFRVEMVMLDEAVIRTFFADVTQFPPRDDLFIVDLEEGRSLATSPFRALVQASLDGTPASVAENVQFENLSPAVSRWMLHIDMTNGQNAYLIPELIDDIELKITYKFGRPRIIDFPS